MGPEAIGVQPGSIGTVVVVVVGGGGMTGLDMGGEVEARRLGFASEQDARSRDRRTTMVTRVPGAGPAASRGTTMSSRGN